jgi:membrane fusion protein (multidrug efflux system)
MKKGLRLTITILIIVFILGVILYPKFKPYIQSKLQKGIEKGAPIRKPQQKLNAVGYIIVPTQLSELRNSTGTLRPDEEVDLSFETSGNKFY